MINYQVILATLTLACLSTVSARFSRGRCSTPHLEQNFDTTRYAGLWYEIYRDSETPFETNMKCVTATYGLNDDGTLSVKNIGVDIDDGDQNIAQGYAYCQNGEGDCTVKFNFLATGSYQVVETDYETYSLVSSCSDYYFFKTEFFWILSKNQTLPDSKIEQLKNVIERELPNYTFGNLLKTQHDETCVYPRN
ncbi:apolipoprotein d-like [Stylonychia lemnae]|uniref:Apolipoprotein d-like n=1 Tax=Stylonychia lemnae TaxID=5949 RepID=A0A078AAF2_STYLE|nr:apolipoprotein d-like [Stylonychia lemnae]|eukprot:CDW79245.1 apolipoprotein d-like [Stylonychia lemnae]